MPGPQIHPDRKVKRVNFALHDEHVAMLDRLAGGASRKRSAVLRELIEQAVADLEESAA